MRRPPDYRHRPLIVQRACLCALCAAPLTMVERFTPARFVYFIDCDGHGLRHCPGCGQSLDRALRVGALRLLADQYRSKPGSPPDVLRPPCSVRRRR